ncbi:MAG: transporter substrate-binding domain-containing protein [Gammaproteobacteria bacterium]|nr:transporter substrate-binding domain-containing protein [Gammaproteobacteria bacterium]
MKLQHPLLTTLAAFTLALTLPLAAAAQGITQQITSASALEQIKKRGVIRVGFGTFVPWAMRNTKGEFVGFEVEVARKLAADNGWDVELVPTAWDGIIPALIAGKFDVIIGGMSATPKRSQTINFTVPYEYSTITMAANTELAPGWSTFEDFNKASVTLVVRRGSSNVEWMKEHFPKATYRYFDDDAQAFQEVMNGNAHGVVSAEPKPSLWSLANADVLYKPFGDQKFNYYPAGFGLRKGDHDFLVFLNTWIQLHTSNGWLAEKHKYWFETNNWFGEVENNPFTKKN